MKITKSLCVSLIVSVVLVSCAPKRSQREEKLPDFHPQKEVQEYDLYEDVSSVVAEKVDSYYSNYSELSEKRQSWSQHLTDRCDGEFENLERFSDPLAYFVDRHLLNIKPRVDTVASYFGLDPDINSHLPTSLLSHPMCQLTQASLSQTLGSKRVPSSSVIEKLNQFSSQYNDLRAETLKGSATAQLQMTRLWTKFMGCLSYTESLTTADSKRSYRVANRYAPKGYKKPAGVNFYEDPYQPSHSRLNIGLFQFTPNKNGNLNSCLRQWDEWHPSCTIGRASQSELIRVLGSSYQAFNSFCGVNKITQSFAIQVNTNSARSTHPENQIKGSLVEASNRCVSPFFHSGKTYNHFGPLQNSTGRNLAELMSCVMAP